MYEILEDDRVSRRTSFLENVWSEEFDWLDSLGDLSWKRFSIIIGDVEATHHHARNISLCTANVSTCSFIIKYCMWLNHCHGLWWNVTLRRT